MKNYIGVKLIKAEPMTVKEYNEKVRPLVYSGDSQEGYKVEYSDSHVSWSPKEMFENAYLEVDPNPRLKSNVSISPRMVEDFIKEKHVSTIGEKTTLVRVVLVNGFEIIESSACVDKENYSEELGAEVCMKKIKDKIWFLLGFLLQTAVGGVK